MAGALRALTAGSGAAAGAWGMDSASISGPGRTGLEVASGTQLAASSRERLVGALRAHGKPVV
jgi:hypothetical protein